MPFFQENKKNIEYFLSFRKDVIKSLFAIKQSEIPVSYTHLTLPTIA